MKGILGLVLICISSSAFGAIEKSGHVSSAQIWGGIAKASVCSAASSCTTFWVPLNEEKSQAVLSVWLAAKMSNSRLYIQGYDPDNDAHPYSGASKFYGMNLNN